MSSEQLSRKDILANMRMNGDKFQTFLDSLTSEQLESLCDDGGWAVKDHIIHLTMWERGLLALLNKQNRQEAMGISEEEYINGIESINRAIFENYRHMSGEEVLAYFQETREATLSRVEAMQNDDILLPYKHFDSDVDEERPISYWIIINTYEHYDMHLPWIEAIVAN